jgi:putative nucleotidyltransferase with HDIG domain
MIKRIKFDQLTPGMCIHDLNCSWVDHPFLLNSLMVEDSATVARVAEYGIRELFIDTTKGLDVVGAISKEESDRLIAAKFLEETLPIQTKGSNPTPAEPLKIEIGVARKVHQEAQQATQNMLNDVRLGKQIEIEKLHPMIERITDSVFRNRDALLSLSRIKHKDKYTFQHSVSVCVLLVSFCQAMGYEREVMREVGIGGLLHDIGKMQVPDKILNAPGPLTPEEFAVMQSHVTLGLEMLKDLKGISDIAISVTAQHHERYDGTGYPLKLKGEEITQFGQMASIVDVYDALTSNRIYHIGVQPTDALKKLFEWNQTHFNEDLVHQFIRTVGIYPVGSVVSLESGLIGVVVEPDNKNLLHPSLRIIFDSKLKQWIKPTYVLDLSQSGGKRPAEKIARHESPEKWGINPYEYLSA